MDSRLAGRETWQLAEITGQDFDSLISGCRAGAVPAFDRLFRLFYGYLLRQITYAVRDREVAEEILQDFFVHLIEVELIKKFRGNNILQLMKFLSACARNHMRGHLRSNAREQPLPGEIEAAISSNWLPENLYITRENIHVIEQCFRELKLSWRTILHLEGAGYKHREIAEILNMKVSAVSVNSSRAKSNLRSLLQHRGLLFPMIALHLSLWSQFAKPAFLAALLCI